MNNVGKVGLILGPLLFLVILFFFKPEDLSSSGVGILASTVWIATWWITEAIPIAATALLPIVLFPLTGGLDLNATSAAYGHKFVFLYLGGFLVAIAIEKWKLHRRIALSIIYIIGTNVNRIILGFMAATAFLSMWISNTATAVMMLPIAMAIIVQMKDDPRTKEDEHANFAKSMMLAIAYSASIGGIATLIGTPPNLVLAGVIKELYDYEISFVNWMIIGVPISLLLLIILYFYLTRIAFPFRQKSFPAGKEEIAKLRMDLGSLSVDEGRVLAVFMGMALLWIFRSWIENYVPFIDDTIIAIMCGLLLFVIPSTVKDEKLLTWEEAVKLPWGIILLFGGGMALASGFSDSGLAEYIGGKIGGIGFLSPFLLVLIVVFLVNFLTEVTSNLATTAMLLPVLATTAVAVHLHPLLLMVPATIAASCAFMLPVATPPNAVVFGSGHLRIPDMVKAGIWMNVISAVLVTVLLYFLLPLVWDFDIRDTLLPEG